MTQCLGPVLSARDLPPAELCAARLDGDVYALGEFWCPIDEVDGLRTRALAAGLLVQSRMIVAQSSAAWVYGVAPEPRRHQFCVDRDARAHLPPSARVRVREVRIAPEDIRSIEGVRVTTPLRTVLDLAHCSPTGEPGLAPILAELLRYGGFGDVAAAVEACRRQSLPGTVIALRRLAEAQLVLGP